MEMEMRQRRGSNASSSASKKSMLGKDHGTDGHDHSRGETYEKLSWAVTLCYGLPHFSILPSSMLLAIHASLFYEQMGAQISWLALFAAIARSIDVVSDPLMGWISDSTRTRWGRRKPYMIACVGWAVAFTLLLRPPIDKEGNSTAIWYGIFYITFYLFDTITTVPYGALGPELTPVSEQRTRVFFFSRLYSGIGTLLAATAPLLAGLALGHGADASLEDIRWEYTLVGMFFGVAFVVAVAVVLMVVKERAASAQTRPIPLVPSVLRSFKNKAFRPLLLGWVFDSIALSSLASMFPFFITYVIRPTTLTVNQTLALCFAALFIANIISMPLWLFIAKKLGKYRAWLLFNILNSITNAGYIFVGEGDPYTTILITIMNGIPTGGGFLTDSILSDVVDYDEFLNGTRSEAGFTVFATFIPKFVAVPAQALPLSIMAMIGFRPSDADGNPVEQTSAVRAFIRFMFVVVPVFCTLAAFFVKRHYPLKTAADIQMVNDGIAKHEVGEEAQDPVTGRKVGLLNLSEEESIHAFDFDNFGQDTLRELTEPRGPDKLVGSMTIYFVINLLVFIALLGTTIGLGDYINHPNLNIIPILGVVFSGVAFCCLAVNTMRLKTARKLRAEGKLDTKLLKKVIAHKDLGQRGGDEAEWRDVIATQIAAIEILSAEKDTLEEKLAWREHCLDELVESHNLPPPPSEPSDVWVQQHRMSRAVMGTSGRKRASTVTMPLHLIGTVPAHLKHVAAAEEDNDTTSTDGPLIQPPQKEQKMEQHNNDNNKDGDAGVATPQNMEQQRDKDGDAGVATPQNMEQQRDKDGEAGVATPQNKNIRRSTANAKEGTPKTPMSNVQGTDEFFTPKEELDTPHRDALDNEEKGDEMENEQNGEKKDEKNEDGNE